MSENNRKIDLQAAQWAVRLDAGALTQNEQVELNAWLAANARHRGALLHWQAALLDTQRVSALAGHQSPLVARARPNLSGARKIRTDYGRPTNRRWFMAAGVMALTIAGSSAWWTLRRKSIYVTDVGEIRRVPLADGSSMVLNTATEATVNFDRARREIELATGEGLFEVAKDPSRPFIVRTRRVSVRAVGTVFSVRSLEQRVDITVTEGAVELVENGSGAESRVIRRVTANESATVMEARPVVEVQGIQPDEAKRRLAWRDGMLAFAGETLTTAVDEINRHNHRRVVIDDIDLGGRRVDGLFRASDPDGFAEAVAVALGAQRVDQDDAIHLRPRSSK